MSITIHKTLEGIASDIESLSSKKNINEVTVLHTTIETKIENAKIKVQKLKKKYETNEKTIQEMSESDYEKAIAKLSSGEIDKILNSGDLELLIDECCKVESKIESCIHHLKNKKLTIVECDKEPTTLPIEKTKAEPEDVTRKSCTKKTKKDETDSDSDKIKLPKSKKRTA